MRLLRRCVRRPTLILHGRLKMPADNLPVFLHWHARSKLKSWASLQPFHPHRHVLLLSWRCINGVETSTLPPLRRCLCRRPGRVPPSLRSAAVQLENRICVWPLFSAPILVPVSAVKRHHDDLRGYLLRLDHGHVLARHYATPGGRVMEME